MNTAVTSPGMPRPQGLRRWLAELGASLSWAMEMRRRCNQEIAAGPLNEEGFSRIAVEVGAWVERR